MYLQALASLVLYSLVHSGAFTLVPPLSVFPLIQFLLSPQLCSRMHSSQLSWPFLGWASHSSSAPFLYIGIVLGAFHPLLSRFLLVLLCWLSPYVGRPLSTPSPLKFSLILK